jgi:hypothetical protein
MEYTLRPRIITSQHARECPHSSAGHYLGPFTQWRRVSRNASVSLTHLVTALVIRSAHLPRSSPFSYSNSTPRDSQKVVSLKIRIRLAGYPDGLTAATTNEHLAAGPEFRDTAEKAGLERPKVIPGLTCQCNYRWSASECQDATSGRYTLLGMALEYLRLHRLASDPTCQPARKPSARASLLSANL